MSIGKENVCITLERADLLIERVQECDYASGVENVHDHIFPSRRKRNVC